MGKAFIFIGTILIVVGLLSLLAHKISWIGRLPGDIYIKREKFIFYFPLSTSILVSIVLSLISFFFLGRR